MPDIIFQDIKTAEEAERRRLQDRKYQLDRNRLENDGHLSPELQDELDAIDVALVFVAARDRGQTIPVTLDPLFVALQSTLAKSGQPVRDHVEGMLPSQQAAPAQAQQPAQAQPQAQAQQPGQGQAQPQAQAQQPGQGQAQPQAQGRRRARPLTSNEKTLAAVYGILQRNNQALPGRDNLPNPPDPLPQDAQDFYDAVIQQRPNDAPLRPNVVAAAIPLPLGNRRIDLPPNLQDRVDLRDYLLHRLPRGNGFGNEIARRFSDALARARAEYDHNQHQPLFDGVLSVLVDEGTKGGAGGEAQVDTQQWAAATKALTQHDVKATDFQLRLKVRTVLANFSSGDDDAPSLTLGIDLPDLDDQLDTEIVEANLHALQAIYFAAQLEEMKFFQVFDKLGELAQYGYLPIGRGRAGDILFQAFRKTNNKQSEYERRSLYARTLGVPGGDPGQGQVNREFNDLWLRFLSAVSSYVRQFTLDDVLRARFAGSISQEQVRKAGRDLAVNLSLHGYGLTYQFATELQSQINDVITLLSDTEIKSAYGARDMYQVIDQVAQLELGGARNSTRYRTMAQAGAIIIRWLADHAAQLQGPNGMSIINMDVVRRPGPRFHGAKPTTDPTDADLVNACEQWLAVTGTPEARVEEYAQPAEAPLMATRPISMPSAARDLLESVGINTNGR